MAAPNWKTYDTNGDGKLTDAELTTWNNVVRAYRNYVDSNFENTYEADIAASESTSVSPYEDGSASASFYGNWGFPVPDTEEETEAALIAAAETGNIDVIEAILSTASNAVSGAVLNTVMETFYDSLDIPAGLDDLSGYGSTPRPDYKIDLDSLADMYLAAGSGNETPLTLMDAQGLALGEHMRAVKDAQQRANAYVDAYGGSFYDYFVMPNQLVELSPLAQEYDANRDGSLDQDEMVGYTEAWEKENGIMRFADGTSATAATAEAADLDGDGQISPQELSVWEADRASDTDPNPSRTAFLADYGFDASPSAAWVGKFARESAESFQTGAQQILTQGLQDAAIAILGMYQKGLLDQLESGADTLSRPIIDKDAPAYSIIGADIDSYFERIFDGKDTISRDALLTNDEFYDVGIQLATRNSSTPALSAEGITLTDTDQALVDRYVAVRDDYQAGVVETADREQKVKPLREAIDDLRTKMNGLEVTGSPEDQAGKSGLDRALAWASGIIDGALDLRQNLDSAVIKAAGGTLEGIAGAAVLWGEHPMSTKQGQIGRALSGLGNDRYTPELKQSITGLNELLGKATGAQGKIDAFYDGIQEYPSAFIIDLIGVEIGQEVIPLAAGGVGGAGVRGAALGKGIVTDVAERMGSKAAIETEFMVDLAEAGLFNMGGAYETALESLMLPTTINPNTNNPYTREEAEDKAWAIAIPAGLTGMFTTWASTLIGGQALENLVFKNRAPSADEAKEIIKDFADEIAPGSNVFGDYLSALAGRTWEAAKDTVEAGLEWGHATLAEVFTEGVVEGGAQASYLETALKLAGDDTRDYTGNIVEQIILEGFAGAGVSGSMGAGSFATGALYKLTPEVKEAVDKSWTAVQNGANPAEEAAKLASELEDIGVTDTNLQNDFANVVNNEGYTTREEAGAKFDEAGYEFTEEELAQYTGELNEADTLNNIDTYVDPRQVTVDEAKAELIAQGITDPNDAEIAAYVGQGDETFQSTKNTEIETYADPRVIDDAEARAALQAQGIANPKQEEIDQFTGQGDENFETNNIGKATDYANPLALSAAEIEGIAAKQGYTLAAGEAEALSGRVIPGQTEAEALASQENTFNNAAITAAELEAIAAAQGYTLTPEDRALIGNNPNAAQELLNASNRFNAGAITREEIETAARNAGIDPADLTESDYALVGTITEKDADGNFIPAEDILAGEQARFEGRVADATAAERKAAAEAAITAAVTAAGAPALSPTDLQRYVAMAIGGGLTIAEAVQAAEADIAAAAATDDGAAVTDDGETVVDETVDGDAATDDGAVDPFVSYLNGLFERFGVDTNTWPEGNSIGSLQGPNGPIDANGDGIYSPDELIAAGLTEEMGFNPDLFKTPTDDAAATDDGATNDGADSGATTDSGGNQSVMDQVVAAITAAGVTLAQDKIDEIVADVVSGAVTNIDEAVADKVAEVAGNDTDSGTDNQLDDSTIEGDPDDYVKVKDFNREVGTLQDNIVKLITKLESEGATRDEALAAAIGVPAGQPGGPSGLYAELGKFATSDQAEAIKKVVDGIATELGTTADDVAAIKIKLDTLVTKDDISGLATKEDVTDAEGRLNTRIEELEAEGKTRLDAVDIALEELATDLGTTKKDITDQLTKFESDLALDIAELATKQDVLDSEKRIRDKQDEYVRQGMKADEALQAAINDVATELGVTKDVLTDQLAAFQTKLDADLSLLATKQQVNTLETELYLKLAEYEAQGKTRDEATQLAIADLATDLETTEDNLMTRLGVTQDTLTDRINEVETNLTNQFNSQIESTKELITETATETQKQIQTTANQSAARDFFDMVLGSEDLEGQEVTVSQSPLAQINYIYDFQDPLANQQQRGFFGAASPYGESLAAGKSRRPQTIANVMQGPLNLQGAPVGPMGMAAGGKVDYDFLNEISQIMSFGE